MHNPNPLTERYWGLPLCTGTKSGAVRVPSLASHLVCNVAGYVYDAKGARGLRCFTVDLPPDDRPFGCEVIAVLRLAQRLW
jgi:hypothetical protein